MESLCAPTILGGPPINAGPYFSSAFIRVHRRPKPLPAALTFNQSPAPKSRITVFEEERRLETLQPLRRRSSSRTNRHAGYKKSVARGTNMASHQPSE